MLLLIAKPTNKKYYPPQESTKIKILSQKKRINMYEKTRPCVSNEYTLLWIIWKAMNCFAKSLSHETHPWIVYGSLLAWRQRQESCPLGAVLYTENARCQAPFTKHQNTNKIISQNSSTKKTKQKCNTRGGTVHHTPKNIKEQKKVKYVPQNMFHG